MVISMSIISGCRKESLDKITSQLPTGDEETLYKASIKKFIEPENFVAVVNNPYFPLAIGDTLFYSTVNVEEGDTTIEESYVAVTSDVKIIQQIKCTVLHDVVIVDGMIVEDTYDWHAQDIYGNVWYFGEDTKSLQEDGTWSTEGSFESGVDGALAGIIMPADNEKYLGETYRQEHYPGHAQDKAITISIDETVTIGYGTFSHCVLTQETTPLEPDVISYKWYAPGIGPIKNVTETGGDEHGELVGMN
jgi:hypothetical protein